MAVSRIVVFSLSALFIASAIRLPASAASTNCMKLPRREQMKCIEGVADAQRRAAEKSKRDAKMRPNTDKDGRKFAYFKIMGVRPGVESQILPGDEVLPGNGGSNNIVIYYKNHGKKMWTSTSNSIYKVQFDPNTKHYSGLDEKERRISTTKTKFKDAKQKKRMQGKGVNFDEPVSMEICLETKFDNCFFKSMTVKIEGNDQDGYSVPGEIWLESYVRQGTEHGPALPYTRKEEREKKEAEKQAVIAKNRAKYAKKEDAAPAAKPAPAPAAPAAAKPAGPAPKPMFVSKGAQPPARGKGAFSRLARRALEKSQSGKGGATPASFAKTEIFVKGFSPSLASQLEKDPIKVKKGKFKIKMFFKNADEPAWANIQGKTIKDKFDEASKSFRDFDLHFEKYENQRMSFDKPLTVRVEATSESKGLYWVEVERTKETLGDPIVIDQYTPR